jgi:hypothetical protein
MSRARKKKEEMSGISLGVLSSGALADSLTEDFFILTACSTT